VHFIPDLSKGSPYSNLIGHNCRTTGHQCYQGCDCNKIDLNNFHVSKLFYFETKVGGWVLETHKSRLRTTLDL